MLKNKLDKSGTSSGVEVAFQRLLRTFTGRLKKSTKTLLTAPERFRMEVAA